MMRMERKTERRLAFFLVLAMMLALVGCTPESPPVDPPSVTPTEVVVGVPSDTPTPVPSVSATPTVDPTVTNTPTPTEEVLSVTPTEEVTPTATPTDEPEVTDTPTPDPTATDTPVPTNTPTKAPTKVPNTPTQPPATNTPTPKPTATNTPTPEPTPTQAVVEQPKTMWICIMNPTLYEPIIDDIGILTEISGHGLQKGDKVTMVRKDVLNRPGNELSEIQYKGGTAYIWNDELSDVYVEGPWAEPRERKDLEDILMAKVNAYRQSKGIPKFESPFVYFDEFEPNAGANMVAEGLATAKKSCLEHSANHNSRQIGVGIYGNAATTPQGGRTNEQLCEELFQGWYKSPGHNANMLDNDTEDGYRIMVAVMTVVEYYDGYSYGYCAIMTHNRPIVSK